MEAFEITVVVSTVVIVFLLWLNRERVVRILKRTGGGTRILDTYSRDLTAQAAKGKLDPVINRKKEIMRVIQILSRRTKNNPILLGEAGVGKTAIAEGLAQRIAAGEVPESLKGKRVLAINVSGLIAGTKYRGEFEQRLKKLMEEIRAAERRIVLFIDEVHVLLEAKGAEGAMDPADILKPALARGELQAIGATTKKNYEKHIKPDESMERRFQPVLIAPPTVKMTIEILRGIAVAYERHHQVKYTLESLQAATVLSERYIKNRNLPDKAIDLIDEAAAKVRLKTVNISQRLTKIEEEIARLREAKKKSKSKKSRGADKKIVKHKKKIVELQRVKENDNQGIEKPQVGVEDIKLVLSEWVGIPKNKIKGNLSLK